MSAANTSVSDQGSDTELNDASSLQAVVSHQENFDIDDADEGVTNDVEVDPVMQEYQHACQSGDLPTVKRLVETKAIDVKQDWNPHDKISGLHWAAINNRLAIAKYLISAGADVNAQAENLHSTPLHWAARYGYVYIVDCLIMFGADVSMEDDQGFNLLHLAVNSSNIMLVAYVLFFVVSKGLLDINIQDPKGRTALLWASYQGDSLTVALLLKFGANITLPDEGGFTALHWGVVKGQVHVIKYLIRAGGDFFQKTGNDKDCFVIADDLSTLPPLTNALKSCGFNVNGYPKFKLFEEANYAKFTTFITPLLFIGFAFNLFCTTNVFVFVVMLVVLGVVINHFLQKLVLPSYIGPVDVSDPLIDYSLGRSPLLAGIFFGSLFWVSVVSLFMLLPKAWRYGMRVSGMSTIIILIAAYTVFVKLINSDPGVKPPQRNDPEGVRSTIKQLMDLGKFDTENFCIETWVRKPMRSKYSKFSKGLVSRFDHFCPWVYNDIGLRNHKLFMFFIFLVEAGICFFTHLAYRNFEQIKDKISQQEGKEVHCPIINESAFCYGYNYDKFTFITTIWSLLQGTWIVFLIFMQTLQVIKGVTGFEFSHLARAARKSAAHAGVHTHVDHHAASALNQNFNTTPEDMLSSIEDETEAQDNYEETVGGAEETPSINVSSRKSILTLFCNALGIAQCVRIMRETFGLDPSGTGCSMGASRKMEIPTNYGWKQNLADFWLTSDTQAPFWARFFLSPRDSHALLNGTEVDYFTLYKLPEKSHHFATGSTAMAELAV